MKWNIGEVTIENPVVSAPLAGVSDKAYRILAKEHGCGLVFTEMVSETGLLYRNRKTMGLVDLEGEEQPVAVQLFGSEPESLCEAARLLEDRGVKIIDFNMGCPAPKVVKNGEGAALMVSPRKAYRAFESLVNAVDIPVTVKIRKGFDSNSINAAEIAKNMENLGARAVTVHGRTREQYYSGEADWDVIREVVSVLDIPVIGNGDIFYPEDAVRMLHYTGCRAVMIGRGSFGNPWIFRQVLDKLEGRKVTFPGIGEKRRTIERHLELVTAFKGEKVAVREMRKQIAWYIKGYRGAAACREKINRCHNVSEIMELMDNFFRQQERNGVDSG